MSESANPFAGLSDRHLALIEDVFNEVRDDIRHYEDAALGWDSEAISGFWEMDVLFREAAKAAGMWWAR